MSGRIDSGHVLRKWHDVVRCTAAKLASRCGQCGVLRSTKKTKQKQQKDHDSAGSEAHGGSQAAAPRTLGTA